MLMKTADMIGSFVDQTALLDGLKSNARMFVEGTTDTDPYMRALYWILSPMYEKEHMPRWAQLVVPPLRPILRPLLARVMVATFTKSGFKVTLVNSCKLL